MASRWAGAGAGIVCRPTLVRDTTNREKRAYFRNKRPDFFRVLENRPPDARDFEHPFWWAAFYLTGV